MAREHRYSVDEYERQHQHPLNRAAHAIGIPVVALATLALMLPGRARRRRVALAGVASGWALLWTGHAIEGNRPAILRNPAAALVALRWWVSRRGRSTSGGIPRDGAFDNTLALWREGYTFIGNRCRRHGSDLFATRLMLRPVVCMTGEEAARVLYTPGRLTRRGAMPPMTLRLLQDKGSVQLLDGAAHRRRKQMFMDLTVGPHVDDLVHRTDAVWRETMERWQHRSRVVLHDEVREILCRAACAWAGAPLPEAEVQARTREFGSMIDNAGRAGPRAWRALARRRRTERWARQIIRGVRDATIEPPAGTATAVIAGYREADGRLLDPDTAAVELINVLRPTVAVGRFITFAALALHEHPGARERLLAGGDEYAEWFVQEVRRFYPFFPAIGGRVLEEFVWRGHRFARSDWVLLDVYGTNHDPRIWGDADAFRPERFRHWDGGPFTLIPQGGGRHEEGHRCPGEAITIALVKLAVRLLTTAMRYDVPPQDLRIGITAIPALPASGFVMTGVRCSDATY